MQAERHAERRPGTACGQWRAAPAAEAATATGPIARATARAEATAEVDARVLTSRSATEAVAAVAAEMAAGVLATGAACASAPVA